MWLLGLADGGIKFPGDGLAGLPAPKYLEVVGDKILWASLMVWHSSFIFMGSAVFGVVCIASKSPWILSWLPPLIVLASPSCRPVVAGPVKIHALLIARSCSDDGL